VLAILLISVPIIFQPEFRRALQRFQLLRFPSSKSISFRVIDEVLLASEWLRKNGYGALIIIERDDVIGDVEAGRGTIIDALPKAKLIETIFYPGSPLHDGAVIINQKGKIWAAGYVVPIPEDINIDTSLYSHFGTRHTAALAITREKDVVAIIVSEEKKWIKIAYKGKILDDTFNASPREILTKLLIREKEEEKRKKSSNVKSRNRRQRKKGDRDATE
jgi:diadenylate cyclase